MTTKTKSLKWFFVMSLIIVTVISCKKNSLKKCEEHTKSPCQEDANKTNIRIKNNSKYDFCNVIIDPSGKLTNYGIVKSGENSCYNYFDSAFQYAYVKLYIGDNEFILQPIDYVGEQPLGVGKFTYSIDVSDFNNKTLTLKATKE